MARKSQSDIERSAARSRSAMKQAATRRAVPLEQPASPVLTAPATLPKPASDGVPFVFVAYARADLEAVKGLVESLRATGVTVAWDQDFRAGDNFRRRIDTLIQEARAVLVVWSRSSVASDFVVDEAATASRLDKLLPVVLADLPEAALPLGFRGRHSIAAADSDEILRQLAEFGIVVGPPAR